MYLTVTVMQSTWSQVVAGGQEDDYPCTLDLSVKHHEVIFKTDEVICTTHKVMCKTCIFHVPLFPPMFFNLPRTFRQHQSCLHSQGLDLDSLFVPLLFVVTFKSSFSFSHWFILPLSWEQNPLFPVSHAVSQSFFLLHPPHCLSVFLTVYFQRRQPSARIIVLVFIIVGGLKWGASAGRLRYVR